MFGFLNINKPYGMTSHDVVARLRKVLKLKQIGHAGTLDPIATGVLPIAVGKSTRLFEYFSDEKAYVVTMKFGFVSTTFDSEGEIEQTSSVKIRKAELEAILPSFTGLIKQIPPAHSAVHYNGKRLYELARIGIIPDDIPSREVEVSFIDIISFDEANQEAVLEIMCSKGTYIRSIVNDVGQALGVGAYMTSLQRTQSSNFTIDTAIDLDVLNDVDIAKKHLINPIDVLSYIQKELSDSEFQKVKNGNSFKSEDSFDLEVLLLTYMDRLVAVASSENGLIKVSKVLL